MFDFNKDDLKWLLEIIIALTSIYLNTKGKK